MDCVWECKSLARLCYHLHGNPSPLQHTHQRILDGLNEGKNLNIRSLEEQIQAEKAVETYLEARHEAFEIIKVQQLKHVEKKQFEITSFPPFPLLAPSSLPSLSPFSILTHLGE